jgi:hypothetical protein
VTVAEGERARIAAIASRSRRPGVRPATRVVVVRDGFVAVAATRHGRFAQEDSACKRAVFAVS